MNFFAPYLGIAKAIAIIAAALGLLWTGYKIGTDLERAGWEHKENARIEAENRAVFERIRNNERIAEQQEIDRQKLKKGHADEIAKVRAAYAADRGLRINADVCSGLAKGTETARASGGDGRTPATVALPDQVERDLRALMLEADTIVAGCRVAQNFILDNGMAP